jgi:hypothetical protein
VTEDLPARTTLASEGTKGSGDLDVDMVHVALRRVIRVLARAD